jgi:hypothetical protein
MKTRRLWVLGLATFLLALLWRAPAASLYGWSGLRNGPVQALGLDGHLGAGSAAALALGGQPVVQDLRWRFEPWWLLLLRAAFRIEGGGDTFSVNGRLEFTPSGINLKNTRLAGGAKALLAPFGFAFAPIDGQAGLDLSSLSLRDGFPVWAEGVAQIHRLAWTLGRDPLALGDVQATISTANGVVLARIEPLGGPLDVGGDARLTPADRSYELDLQLKAKDLSNTQLSNLLHTLGQPDVQGWYHVRNRGKLGGGPPGPPPPRGPRPPPGAG